MRRTLSLVLLTVGITACGARPIHFTDDAGAGQPDTALPDIQTSTPDTFIPWKPPHCGSHNGFYCPTGYFCPADCLADDTAAICSPIPEGQCPLTDFESFVCGCNGETYFTTCDANQAGVNVVHEGPCGTVSLATDKTSYNAGESIVATLHNLGIETTYYSGCVQIFSEQLVAGIWVDKGAHVDCDWAGFATPLPHQASHQETLSLAPGHWRLRMHIGFGCDAQKSLTAQNCSRVEWIHAAEITVSENVCGTNADCAGDEFCELASCGETVGKCEKKPVCNPSGLFSPVCGCDGMTYNGECEAHAQGVNVSSQGECPPGVPPNVTLTMSQTEYSPGEQPVVTLTNLGPSAIWISSCPTFPRERLEWVQGPSGTWSQQWIGHNTNFGWCLGPVTWVKLTSGQTEISTLPNQAGIWRSSTEYYTCEPPLSSVPCGPHTIVTDPFTVRPTLTKCNEVDGEYQVALGNAKQCGAGPHCSALVNDTLMCQPCKTVIAQPQLLEPALHHFKTLLCDVSVACVDSVPQCGPPPTTGVCSAGICSSP